MSRHAYVASRLASHATLRDRTLLQRVHDYSDRGSSTIHWILSQECRRVQQCLSKRQTWSNRFWHCLCLDMGRDIGEYRYSSSILFLLMCPYVAAIKCCCLQVRYLGSMVVWCWSYCTSSPFCPSTFPRLLSPKNRLLTVNP